MGFILVQGLAVMVVLGFIYVCMRIGE